MSFNFDFELPDFSNIDLTGLPSNLNLGPLGTSGASTMDSPPQQIDAAVDAALSRLIAQYIQSGENPYRADYDINGDGTVDNLDALHQQQIEQGLREPITPAVDPATAATGGGGGFGYNPETGFTNVEGDTTATGITPESIMQYIQSGENPYRADYDIDGDGELTLRDAIQQLQIAGGLRNPDGTPVPQLNPAITPQSIIQYAGELGPFIEGMDINGDGTVDVLDAQQLSSSDPEKYPLPETQPDPVTAAVNDAVGGGMLPSGNEPGERDVGIRTPGGTGSVAETEEVINAVDTPMTNAEGDVFVDTSAADALAAQNEADRLAAEQAERDRLAAEQAAANATTAAEALAAQAELDRISAEQVAADQLAADQAAADAVAATNPPGLPDSGEPGERDIDINDPNAPPVTVVDTTTAVDTSATDVVDTTTAVTDMDATVNQTTTETDWWSQYGTPYADEAAAIASGFFKPITGPNGVVAWVPKGPPGGEPGEKELIVDWWSQWNYPSYADAVASGNFKFDDATLTWSPTDPNFTGAGYVPPDNSTTTGWWTGYGYTTEQEAIASDLFAQDADGVWGPKVDNNLPAEGWWVQHNFPDEATAIASNLFQQDPTTGAWTLIPATGGDGSGPDTSQDYLNYVLDGSAMGYNPYVSGQYQSNPYGNAGVPDLGGITSIPVPAPLQNFETPQDQPSAMELFNAGYQSPRTTKST
jgi:hypothetical protein